MAEKDVIQEIRDRDRAIKEGQAQQDKEVSKGLSVFLSLLKRKGQNG